MKRSWSLAQQAVAAFVVMISLLIAIGFHSASIVERLLDTSRSVSHTHEELTELSSFLAALEAAETGKRGFVITGRDEFLAPYHEGKGALGRHYDRITVLFSNDATQAKHVTDLGPLVDERMREIDATIEARRREGFDAAQKLVLDSRHEQVMGQIRKIVGELRAHQQDVLAERKAAVTAQGGRLIRDLGLCALAALALLIVASIVVMSGVMRRVGVAVRGVDSASTELETAARQQVRGARELVSAAGEVSTTMREMVTTSREIAERAERVTELARETAAAAKGGTQIIEGTQQAMASVRQQSVHISASILALGKRSQEIGGILDIVDELADQTNILAVNATIEAVGAGESGRRFGVVAGEIRKLADRVSGSTKDIRRIVDEIHRAASTMVTATGDGGKIAEAGAQRYAKMGQSFRLIAELAGNTEQAAHEIERGTKQQASAIGQASSAIGQVEQTAREGASSAAKTGATASELATLSRQLGQILRSPPAPARAVT